MKSAILLGAQGARIASFLLIAQRRSSLIVLGMTLGFAVKLVSSCKSLIVLFEDPVSEVMIILRVWTVLTVNGWFISIVWGIN